MTFAEFLDVMHQHTKQEKIPKEIVQAFKGHDTARRGMIPARNLKHILLRWGECLSPREGESRLAPATRQQLWSYLSLPKSCSTYEIWGYGGARFIESTL